MEEEIVINERDYQEVKRALNKKDDYFSKEELHIVYKNKEPKRLYQKE